MKDDPRPDERNPDFQLRQFSQSWLGRQVERRKAENALIRRWFELADNVLGRKRDTKPEEK